MFPELTEQEVQEAAIYDEEQSNMRIAEGELCEDCNGQLYTTELYTETHLDDNPLVMVKCLQCGYTYTE
jgi:DNA-directed RNA polymerase subunit M/transcription elongation factor TFIIS